MCLWEWMIRSKEEPPAGQEGTLEEIALRTRDGKLKSGYAHIERAIFSSCLCIAKLGRTGRLRGMAPQTELPDGRIIVSLANTKILTILTLTFTTMWSYFVRAARLRFAATRRRYFLRPTFTAPRWWATASLLSAAWAMTATDGPDLLLSIR